LNACGGACADLPTNKPPIAQNSTVPILVDPEVTPKETRSVKSFTDLAEPRNGIPFKDTVPSSVLAATDLTELPVHVALVDDDAGSRRGLSAMLASLGCKCETYESVRSFLHSHAMRRVDCIILDIAMPEIDGLTAEKGLRQTNYTGPIIFCTGYAEEEIREGATAPSAAHFLRKPVTKAALLKVLQAAAKSAHKKKKTSA
jgi:CheY-like chemotaxis protein